MFKWFSVLQHELRLISRSSFYSCGLSTIEYSCPSQNLSVSLSVYMITKKNGSIHLKLVTCYELTTSYEVVITYVY